MGASVVSIASFPAAGFALGVFAGLVPAGPVAFLVIRRGLQNQVHRAVALGIGAALASGIWVTLALFGMTWLLQRYEPLAQAMKWTSAAVLFGVGVWLSRARPLRESPDRDRTTVGDLLAGFGLVIMNPTVLLTWSVVTGFLLTSIPFAWVSAWRIAFPVMVALGIPVGVAILVAVTRRIAEDAKDRWIRRALRAMSMAVVVAGLWAGVNAARGG